LGSSPYWYYIPYEENKNQALIKLVEREFTAGRYYPVMRPPMPLPDDISSAPSPGNQHNSIEEARYAAQEEGTQSILDLGSAANEDQYCVARILTNEELHSVFSTQYPTREQVEYNLFLFLFFFFNAYQTDLLDKNRQNQSIFYLNFTKPLSPIKYYI
jgi:hypothetical protein